MEDDFTIVLDTAARVSGTDTDCYVRGSNLANVPPGEYTLDVKSSPVAVPVSVSPSPEQILVFGGGANVPDNSASAVASRGYIQLTTASAQGQVGWAFYKLPPIGQQFRATWQMRMPSSANFGYSMGAAFYTDTLPNAWLLGGAGSKQVVVISGYSKPNEVNAAVRDIGTTMTYVMTQVSLVDKWLTFDVSFDGNSTWTFSVVGEDNTPYLSTTTIIDADSLTKMRGKAYPYLSIFGGSNSASPAFGWGEKHLRNVQISSSSPVSLALQSRSFVQPTTYESDTQGMSATLARFIPTAFNGTSVWYECTGGVRRVLNPDFKNPVHLLLRGADDLPVPVGNVSYNLTLRRAQK